MNDPAIYDTETTPPPVDAGYGEVSRKRGRAMARMIIEGMVIVFVSLILLAGCVNSTDAVSSKYVKGTVLDSARLQPIDSARIYLGYFGDSTLGELISYTDTLGRYVIFIGRGTNGAGMLVTAEKTGYLDERRSFRTDTVDTALVDFTLKRIGAR